MRTTIAMRRLRTIHEQNKRLAHGAELLREAKQEVLSLRAELRAHRLQPAEAAALKAGQTVRAGTYGISVRAFTVFVDGTPHRTLSNEADIEDVAGHLVAAGRIGWTGRAR